MPLERRRLGRTGVEVCPIGLGGIATMKTSVEDAYRTMKTALDLGVDFVDTGQGYGDSQQKIGAILHTLGCRTEVFIATKSAVRSRKKMLAAIDESLEALKTDYIDLYQFHVLLSPEDYDQRVNNGVLDALCESRERGKVRFLGVTGHHFGALRHALESFPFDTVQVAYNMGCERAETEVFATAREKDAGIIAMKPLAGGFLVNPKSATGTPKPGAEAMTAQRALEFVLSCDDVSVAIPGMASPEEVRENFAVRTVSLSTAERNAMVEETMRFVGESFCRGCTYCMPCTANEWRFMIPEILRLEGWYTRYGYEEWARAQYAKQKVNASACQKCGDCEPRCPYGIPIRDRLARAHEILSS